MLAPLSLTGFFEVYDVALLTMAAPLIAQGLGVSIAAFGIGVAVIRLASLGSVPVMRLADQFGRRNLLIVSLAAFTVATAMTALVWGLVAFVAVQAVARVFLATETGLASVVVAEELRSDRRGAGLSAMGILSGLGFGAVAGLLLVVPLTPLDWRLFYVFALLPLAIVAYLRRNLSETRAFRVARDHQRLQKTVMPRFERRDRRRLGLLVGVVSAFGLVQTSGFFYASDLAQTTYGWSGLFTTLILVSAAFGVLGYWLGGRVSDLVGRRPMMALAFVLGATGTVLVFTEVPALFPPGLFLLAAAGSCFMATSVAYAAELFPTEIRSTASSLVLGCQVASGSVGLALLGGLSGVVSPYLLMLILGACLVPALAPIRWLPETATRDVVEERRRSRALAAQAGA